MNYSIANNWDDNLINGLKELNSNSSNDKIVEVFGSSAFSQFGSANADLPNVKKEEIEEKIKKAHLLNFKFNYLINSISYPKIKTDEDFRRALRYFEWLVEMGVDSVTIANEDILKFACDNFPQIKINISIVMGVRDVEKVNYLRKKYPNIQRVILHHTLNRDKKGLIEYVKNSKIKVGDSKSIEIELLANEICLYDCPRIREHYISLSKIAQGGNDVEFDWKLCGEIRSNNVRDFLNSCWIRPEDVCIYQDIGIDKLKIAGRKESTNNLLNRAGAYLERSYNGNVMDLFLAEFWPNSKVPFIDNHKLNGYIKLLWENGLKKLEDYGTTDITYIWK